MKTALFICGFVFSLNSVFGQLYVKDNYVFNQGSMVYVKDYVELNTAASNIYLRNEGQLLQGSTVTNGVNRGVGSLSVFQEGTATNFGYNYWCSPVGVATAGAGNNAFQLDQIVKRPIGNITSQTPAFTGSYNGTSTNSLLTISNRWIYSFTAQNNYSNWVNSGQSGAIISGLGFTMKGVSGDDTLIGIGEATVNNPANVGPYNPLNDYQRYDFRGKANDGTINIQVAGISGQYPNSTLTGNPYASAINLNLFLLENSGYTINYLNGVVTNPSFPLPASGIINGNAYFWEHEKPATSHLLVQYIGGYGTYVPNNVNANSPGTYNNASWNTYNLDGSLNLAGGATGTERYKRMFCPIGQGFMIQGTANGNAQMKNIYRAFVKESAANNSEFNKNLNLVSTANNENWNDIPNVAGVDYTQFSKLPIPQIKIHTIFNNQFTKEITMAFNPNTTDGFDTAMDAISYETSFVNDAYFSMSNNPDAFIISTLPFAIDKRIPFTFKAGNQATFKVFVGDVINFSETQNVYLHDRSTGLYHDIKNNFYEVTLSQGIYTNRFEITFKDSNALGVANPLKENVTLVQNNTSQILTVLNPNLVEIKTVLLFDITGKLVLNKSKLGSKKSYEFTTASLPEAVYLVKIQAVDGQVTSQKIIVSSR
jgi:hypothetical protein